MTASNVVPLEQPQADSWAWVEPWIKSAWPPNQHQQADNLSAWRALQSFLIQSAAPTPSAFTAELWGAFIPWRLGEVTENTLGKGLHILRGVIKEASRRGLFSEEQAKAILTAIYVQKPAQPELPEESCWHWVQSWIENRFPADSMSRVRYLGVWQTLVRFLIESGVNGVAELTRQHCFQFLNWRQTKGAKANTARFELCILRAICNEAIERGLIVKNPASKLKIRRQSPKLKPELSPAVMDEILAEIDGMTRTTHKHFYRTSFLLARYHGCRISETRVPLSAVDLASGQITFHMKGDRHNTVLLHPNLRPMFEKLKAENAEWTFAEPSDPLEMSDLWHRFFKRKKWRERIPGICIHALRVSCISQLARANVSQAKAQRYVNHSSTAVHALYLRVQLGDLADCHAALK